SPAGWDKAGPAQRSSSHSQQTLIPPMTARTALRYPTCCGTLGCLRRDRNFLLLRLTSVRRMRIQAILAFLIIYIVWGSTFLAIRYAVETIPPFLTAATRHLIAGAILLAWAWRNGERPSKEAWRAG